MIRRKLVWGLGWLVAVSLLIFGCGSSTNTTTTQDTGGLVILMGDTPLCDVLAFRATLTGITLQSSTSGNTGNPFKGVVSPFITVNFNSLRDLTSLLRITTVNVGTYNQAKIDLGQVSFTFFDPAKSPPVTGTSAAYSDTSPIVNLQPPLTITKGQISALRLDFDVRHSLSVDAQGNLTGSATPAITLTPVTANNTVGFGRLENLRGYILSVTSGSTLTQFLGSISVQLHSGSSAVPQATVNITPDTKFFTSTSTDNIGVPATTELIGTILGGSYVEVDGYVDAQGNVIATSVQIEDQENVTTRQQALMGTIASVTKDLLGNATQLNLYVGEEQPDSESTVPLDSFVQVNLTSNTKFIYSSRPDNFASMPFDATSMAVGQQVIVHGPSTPGGNGSPTLVDADSVYLDLQSHEGNFSSLVVAASDDRTGAFWLKTCETIFQGSSMLVLSSSGTSFMNVTGLSGLSPQPILNVKGLLFYDLQGGTVNGITVPPGTLVLLADEVHSLP